MSRRVRVLVPATSANLGPGFDSFGLALDLHDVVDVTADFGTRPAVPPRVEVTGVGADDVPRDDTHLIIRSLLTGLDRLGRKPVAVSLHCHNRVPHGRGLGSSAAAILAGVLAARELSGEPADPVADLGLAGELEGHLDNVAPCLLGGFTIAWTGADRVARATSLPVHPDIRPVVCIPDAPLSTVAARAVLPDRVPFRDAAFNVARAALLVEGMTRQPELLFEATEDRLHQPYRDAVMPETAALVSNLRAQGLAAVVSGAGPAVLVLADSLNANTVSELARGWDTRALEIQTRGAVVETVVGA